MSRYNCIDKSGNDSAYGFDHACGYFVMVFDKEGELLLDRDSLFGGLTGGELVRTCDKWGIKMTPIHRQNALYDLPF